MASFTAEAINVERLKTVAGEAVYNQGLSIFQKKLVEVLTVEEQEASVTVFDYRKRLVRLSINHNAVVFHCDCIHAARGLLCEHGVAAALAVQAYLRDNPPSRWKAQLTRLLSSPGYAASGRKTSRYLLFFSLQPDSMRTGQGWRLLPYHLPVRKLPAEVFRPDGQADEAALCAYIENTPDLPVQSKSYSSNYDPAGCVNCDPASVMLANVLLDKFGSYSYYYSLIPIGNYLDLIARSQAPLFSGTQHRPLERALQVVQTPGEMRLHLSREKRGLRLTARIVTGDEIIPIKGTKIKIVTVSPAWALADGRLLPLSGDVEDSLFQQMLREPEVRIPPQEETDFLEKFYMPLAEKLPLEGEAVSWETVQVEPVRRLYLNDAKGELQAVLRFGYGEYEVGYEANLPEESLAHKPGSWTLVRIQRRPEVEQEAYSALSSATYGLKRAPYGLQTGTFVLRARVHPVDFLLHNVPKLAKDEFEIYGEERLKTARVNRSSPTLSFRVSSGIDWFDIQTVVNFGELEVSLKEIRKALRKKSRYLKLADGTIGEIPEDWLERYKHLFALGEESEEGIRLSNHHVTLIDQLLAGAERAQTDAEFERRRKRLRDFSGIDPVELPQGFDGELRPYQKAGYDWLHFLHAYRFGGCLADDMGLGKTVQVLAFLQSLKEGLGSGEAPKSASLIIVPRSLLVNWQREAARFTPGLRMLEYFDKDRDKKANEFEDWDVIITTYGVMMRDIPFLRQYEFHYVILDESQAIKNPLSQTAKSARLLQARHRLVLTGTPVENSSVELWSQFAFLNPGLLGNLEYFKTEFSGPIERKGDEGTADFLRKMVYPFILRRTKDQVAPELPPRSERILFCDLDAAQRKLYNRTRDYYRGLLLGMFETEGGNGNGAGQGMHMKVLEGLLRLRQISNHPRLVEAGFRGDSGKFELLLETLETLQAEGHKALVFSQFVQMLALVRQELDVRNIPYCYLDGQTRDRQERVDTFQNDLNIPFFLISLKAGGIGLNLTAADYVIHIDPWWNPAVEMQASDRTHRIGQDKPVFVYKLIARDTVEEKILQLQARKKELVEQIVATEGSFLKTLSKDDIEVLFK